ncbi:MAG TPA: PEPxxWA-CTERM sorting domain-containing protein [Caulobacteraceae bacterium]|nr:PEPxxWA-CTERM sorting domain-containing protein [Caulobacteraceae bacterium]
MRKVLIGLAATAGALALAGQAGAVTFVASGTGGDGAESAKAVLTTSGHTLDVALSSLIANPKAAGQEVSDIEITFANSPGVVTFQSDSQNFVTITRHKKAANTWTTSTGATTHWGVATSSDTVTLATAGPGSVGGKPIDLIIGNSGSFSNANPSITGRNPQILGTGNFDLMFSGAVPKISSVVFSFGTGPDNFLPGQALVPEPASWALMMMGAGLIGGALRRRRKLAAA